jgi:hypothetical protein
MLRRIISRPAARPPRQGHDKATPRATQPRTNGGMLMGFDGGK